MTTSLVDYLKSTGQDTSLASRKTLAASKGITNYTGTAAQNNQLLGALQSTPRQPQGLSLLTGTGANAFTQPSAPSLTSFQAPQVAQPSFQQTPSQLAQPTLLSKVAQGIKSAAGNLTANIGGAFAARPGSGTPTPGPSVYDYGTPGTPGYIPAQITPQPQVSSAARVQSAPVAQTVGTGFLLTEPNAFPTADVSTSQQLAPEQAPAQAEPLVPSVLDSTAHQSSSIQPIGQKNAGGGVASSSGSGAGSGAAPQYSSSAVQGATPIQTVGLNIVPQGQNLAMGQNGASTGFQVGQSLDATIGQNGQAPLQVGGRFGTQNFGRVGNDVVEIMTDGSQRAVSAAEFQQKLQPRGLNIDAIPQLDQTQSFSDGTPSGPAGSGPDGIMGTADDAPPEKGPANFVSDYQSILKELGITNIKTQFEDIQKQFKDLQDEKLEAQGEINDNPWLAEGVRVSKLKKLDEKYAGKESNLTNMMKLTQSLYEEGLAQAKFLTSGLQEDRNKLLDLAMKREEAEAKINEARDKLSPGIIGEYEFARQNGYKGTFIQYQNEDANRTRKTTTTESTNNPVLSTAQEYTLKARGISPTLYNDITRAILGGTSLEEIRQALTLDGLSPQILDTYDQVVNIKKLLGGGSTSTSGRDNF